MIMQANIQEIFRSIQGEGFYAGTPTTFVRFSGCNLRCAYCDTKKSWRKTKYCAYQPVEFTRRWVRVPNEVAVADCADLILGLSPRGLVSFTGGEPLLHAGYIARVIKSLGGAYTYLIETNGTLPAAVRRLPDLPNIVYSIDIKNRGFVKFYQAVPRKSGKYVKIILTKKTEAEETLPTLREAGVSARTPIFLQPVDNKLDKKQLQKFMYILEKNGYTFKVIPQLHRFVHLK
ncbi:queuosine biosynthesis QueE radical SAM [Candidatus Termititenax persephonae]|uniref:7-carboxy-7-deazaguanine synthase n=1 Tax=Candidatus Termititenax persephonae TaxID=2218525 RepID=A0A388TI61_9BACT|nr:queuosine biosynthesis QueE radical SAM [Candidatus Termititenax persephonae]